MQMKGVEVYCGLKIKGGNRYGIQGQNCVARLPGSEKSAVKTHETKVIYDYVTNAS